MTKRLFAVNETSQEEILRMPESDILNHLKNDGHDDIRKKIWHKDITQGQFDYALADVERHIQWLKDQAEKKEADLNTTFNQVGKGPLEDRVIILPEEANKVTAGGLHIPENQQNAPAKGTVVAVGPGRPDKPHSVLVGFVKGDSFSETRQGDGWEPVYRLESMPLKPGDKVLYGKFAGLEIKDPATEKKYLVMRLSDVFILA
jgi:chaperonin GroES